MTFSLKSPAFGDGGRIPAKYTPDEDDLSPPLEWSDPPVGTKSFALVVEDPDAPSGTFIIGVFTTSRANSRCCRRESATAPRPTPRPTPRPKRRGSEKASMISASRDTTGPPRRRDTEPITTTSSWRRWMSKRFRGLQRCPLPISGSRLKSTCSGRPNSSAFIVGDANGGGLRPLRAATRRCGRAIIAH